MRKAVYSVLIFLVILVFYLSFRSISSSNTNISKTPSATPFIETIADKLWPLIQDWRRSQGFQPYIKSQELCRIAEDRAKDKLDYHKGFLEKYSSYPYVLAENVCTLAPSNIVLTNWLSSPPHRATLEKPYKYSCVACDKTCVQIFSNL